MFQLADDLQIDYESYSWKKLDPNTEETKTLVEEYLSWEGNFGGKKVNQGKIFKWKISWHGICFWVDLTRLSCFSLRPIMRNVAASDLERRRSTSSYNIVQEYILLNKNDLINYRTWLQYLSFVQLMNWICWFPQLNSGAIHNRCLPE